jgi:hypothetical protein
MKKVMNTTFIAILLVAISTNLTAKQMRNAVVTTPAQTTKQLVTPAQPQIQVKQTKTEEELIVDAQDVLKTIPEERTYLNDIVTGYSQDQKEAAKDIFRRLAAQEKIIKFLTTEKEKALSLLSEKGWFGRTYPKAEKEEEYAETKEELNELKELLSKIQKNMRDQAIIAGEKWSTAFKLGVASTLTIVAVGGGAYALGTTGLANEYAEFKKNPTEYIKNRSVLVPTALYNWLKSKVTNESSIEAARTTWETIKSIGTGVATTIITQKAANQLMLLLEDPNTDESEKNEIRETLAQAQKS